jgi:Protein of unknown function DUF262
MTNLQVKFGTKSVDDFTHLYEAGKLNLNPGFQRNSVWNVSDRRKLIESILQNYPVPSIFLFRRTDHGICYDVLDGKQRLEAVLKFQGHRRIPGDKFSARLISPSTGTEEIWDWAKLRRANRDHQIAGYEFQTVEVTGDLNDIIDLFVRINSTGKSLTSAERRKAKFWNTEFLKKVASLAEKKRGFFEKHGLLTRAQMSRMKHVELLSELMVSVQSRGLIDKKKALDDAMEGKKIAATKVQGLVKEVVRTLSLIEKIFPNFGETRFRNAADFYSLFMCVRALDSENAILSNRKRNYEAQILLSR